MSLSLEEIYVKHIENGIRGIKLGTKKPEDINVWAYLNKLRNVNDGLCDELTIAYQKVLEMHRKNEEKLAYMKKNTYIYRNK